MPKLLSKRIGGTIIKGPLVSDYAISLCKSLEKEIIRLGLDDKEFWERKRKSDQLIGNNYININ